METTEKMKNTILSLEIFIDAVNTLLAEKPELGKKYTAFELTTLLQSEWYNNK